MPNPFRYNVVISPEGWRQAGSLPYDDYIAIGKALDKVATKASEQSSPLSQPRDASDVDQSLSLVVGEYVVLYAQDDQARTITLRGVAKQLSEIRGR